MNFAIILIAVVVALFLVAYITKRRFGVLGLALAAGAMLSSLWAETLTPLVAKTGFETTSPPLITVVSVILILTPAILLLFGGPSYKKGSKRLIGALLFAILAIAFLIEPLGSAFILIGDSKQIYDFFLDNRIYIITVALIIAILDLLFAHSTKHSRRS